MMFCGYRHLRVDHKKRYASGKVYVNGLEGFWSFAKERLIKFHGVSPEKFPLYLKEMEFRYNHRKCRWACKNVPVMGMKSVPPGD